MLKPERDKITDGRIGVCHGEGNSLRGLLFLLAITLPALSPAQWSLPRMIDRSASTIQRGPLIAVGPDRQLAVVCGDSGGMFCYTSTDNGLTFERALVTQGYGGWWGGESPREPDWVQFDSAGNIFVFWRREILGEDVTIGTRFGVSVSDNRGRSFRELWNSRQTYGVPVGSNIQKCWMDIDQAGFVHVLWDSSGFDGYPSNMWFYSKFLWSDPHQRIDYPLPGPLGSVARFDATMMVEEQTIHFFFATQHDVNLFYARSTDGGSTFFTPVLVDGGRTISPRLAKASTGQILVVYEQVNSPPSRNTLVVRVISDTYPGVGDPVTIGPRVPYTSSAPAVLLSEGQVDYLVYGTDGPEYGTVCYKFDDLALEPIDSAFFPLGWDPDFAMDHLGGKYAVFYYANRVHITGEDIVTSPSNEDVRLPAMVALSQNYPNPFNPVTILSFTIPQSSIVNLRVYDLLGREVATLVNEELAPGTYTRQWDADGIASGIYFYRLETGAFQATRKLLLLR